VRGAIVHNPEDPPGSLVRSLGHYLAHQPIERCDTGLGLAATKESGVVNIERREVGPRTYAAVFMLDPSGPRGSRRQGSMFADARLDTGVLVGADHELISFQPLPLPTPGVEIQNAASLARELGIAGKDPAAMLPRADGIVVQPAPHRLATDRGDMPERRASRTMSAVLSRDSGRPRVAGNSHAMAFTCTTSSGGKNRGPTRPRSFLESGQALVKEAFAPETDHVAAHRKRSGDFVIAQAFRSEQNHPCSENLEIWQRIPSRSTLQHAPLLTSEIDTERTVPRHSAHAPH
jgi:hypothetical protein